MVDLHHHITIAASPAKVFAAISTTKGNAGWWTTDSKVQAKAGGHAEFGFEKRAAVFGFTVDKITKSKELEMTCVSGPPEWVGTKLYWTLHRDGKNTAVNFSHNDWRELTDHCASCNSMWGRLMFRLKAFAESGKPKPQWKK